MDNSEQREQYSEIDLVDIWIIIRRHLWLFLAVFLVIFILGLVVANLRSVKYDYSVTVQIGGFRAGGTATLVPIMELDAVVDALQNAIIPTVLRSYADAHPGFNPATVNIEVSTPKTGAQVTLETRGTLAQDSLMRELLAEIVNKMEHDQGSLLQSRIVATKELLTQQLVQLESQQSALEKSRQQLTTHGSQSDKALTLLLVDNQIALQQRQLLDLKLQLNVSSLTDVRLTQPITPPQRSVKPSGLGTAAFVAIAFILALFFGLFAVFLVHVKNLASKRAMSTS